MVFEFNYKKFGIATVTTKEIATLNADQYKPYIKVMLVKSGWTIKVDFKTYEIKSPAVFFIGNNQILHVAKAGPQPLQLLFYNRDFYCVQIHDAEVACDGLLFNNIYQMPKVDLSKSETLDTEAIFEAMSTELKQLDNVGEEMIRTYLKQLIIKCTRIWKKQQLEVLQKETPAELQFFRDFSRLVEIHFREKHSVSEYADLLHIAPKTITHKFNRLQLPQPNDVIKDRILLEAKRLLHYSSKSIKEIAYELGYEDPAYFNRLFSSKTGISPNQFRKEQVID